LPGVVRGDVRIGISGWRYAPWRGVFYPKKLVQAQELHYASRHLSTIEINGSFYSTQSPRSYKSWYEQTPQDFVFAVKGPRYLTHYRRLREPEAPLGNFFGSGVLHLKQKLGPILWQLPPSFRFEEDALSEFFENLPHTFQEVARVSAKADRLTPDLPKGAARSRQGIRHALEVRHHSFENPDFIKLLRKYSIALVFADTAGTWPYIEDLTSDFVYIRLHGEKEIYRSGYGPESLRFWRNRIRQWREGGQTRDALTLSDLAPKRQPRDIYVYFDNDVKVRAPFDAMELAKMV
jgi:uncharacterized protein YecE (DUF72 family)